MQDGGVMVPKTVKQNDNGVACGVLLPRATPLRWTITSVGWVLLARPPFLLPIGAPNERAHVHPLIGRLSTQLP